METFNLLLIELSALLLMHFLLSINVIKNRRKYKVAIGDKGEATLKRAVRAQANFTEYTPIVFISHFFLSLAGINLFVLIILCTSLILGRVLHACSLLYFEIKETSTFSFRIAGMGLTFANMIFAVIYFIYFLISQF